jgi:hypothetical protein
MDDILLAASMIATIFNVIVICCAVKLFRRSGDTMHLFIINMTLGDLLLTSEAFFSGSDYLSSSYHIH